MQRRERQSAVSFGLSFLDVLCCGLGAAVLLFLVVKHGPIEQAEPDPYLTERIRSAAAALAALVQVRDRLAGELAGTEQDISAALARIREGGQQKASRATDLRQLQAELADARNALSSSQAGLSAAREKQREADSDTSDAKNQGDLMGLRIEPTRVLILLDRSASMAHRSLVEILRLRAAGVASALRGAEKWVTAGAVARWALDRVEDGGQYQILAFSEQVAALDGKAPAFDWLTQGDPDWPDARVQKALAEWLPEGGTNLRAALQAARRLHPRPEQILLITDGLPTIPGSKRLGRVRGCRSAAGSRAPFLSPECRLNIFLDAVSISETRPRIRTDIVLLPLDGDANAVHDYWLLASMTGGRLLTPAVGWPDR